MTLTEYEKEIHQRLCEKGFIEWLETSAKETKALNRLIKKGCATYNSEEEKWTPLGYAP